MVNEGALWNYGSLSYAVATGSCSPFGSPPTPQWEACHWILSRLTTPYESSFLATWGRGRQVYRGVTGTLFVTISLHLLPIFRKMKKNNFFYFPRSHKSDFFYLYSRRNKFIRQFWKQTLFCQSMVQQESVFRTRRDPLVSFHPIWPERIKIWTTESTQDFKSAPHMQKWRETHAWRAPSYPVQQRQ